MLALSCAYKIFQKTLPKKFQKKYTPSDQMWPGLSKKYIFT